MKVFTISKFRDKTPLGVKQNVDFVELIAFDIAEKGHTPICPQCMYRNFDGTLTDNYWLKITTELLSLCDAAVIGDLRLSSGCADEITYCINNNIPVYRSASDLVSGPMPESILWTIVEHINREIADANP